MNCPPVRCILRPIEDFHGRFPKPWKELHPSAQSQTALRPGSLITLGRFPTKCPHI